MSRGMETDLFDLLRRCLKERDEDSRASLGEQEARLKELDCTEPEMGRWLDHDFPFLIETLMLSDAVFAEEYPEVKVTVEERRRFAHALEGHCEVCECCGLKRALDLEWQARVNSIFTENRETIGRIIAKAVGKR
jgi:hypothetical protein